MRLNSCEQFSVLDVGTDGAFIDISTSLNSLQIGSVLTEIIFYLYPFGGTFSDYWMGDYVFSD